MFRASLGHLLAFVSGLHFFDYLILGTYLVLLIGMGIWISNRSQTTEDYFLASRNIPWWAAGLSIFGTQLSAITFMAIPAKAFSEDWVFILAQFTIPLVAPLVIVFYLPFFYRLQITTAYDFLENRFNRPVRLFGSVSFLLFQLGRMGIVIALPALALATVSGINVYGCIVTIGVLATLYTMMGGMEAVIWTDVLQVVVLIGGALLSLVIILAGIHLSPAEAYQEALEMGKLHTFNWSWDYTRATVWVVVVGNFMANLVPYTTDQTVIQRYMTTPSLDMARRAIWVNALMTIPTALLFFSLGTALFLFYDVFPERITTLPGNDAIFPWFIASELPAGLAGLVLAGLFAASMSSIDSSMNSMATSIIHDFLRPHTDKTEAAWLRLARYLTLGLGIVATLSALLIASLEVKSLWDTFLTIVGLFGGSLAGVFMLGVFTKKANSKGVLIGALSSAVILYLVQQRTEVHFFLYAAIGILSCCVIGYATSLFTKNST